MAVALKALRNMNTTSSLTLLTSYTIQNDANVIFFLYLIKVHW